ncbi:hypothetical protein VTI74DRAFT_5211 [Chaetomium olivicolor]
MAMSDPSPPPPEVSDGAQQPQCWECRRRRRVCDGAQPVCSKCRAARIVCPGYANKKPLTWLAPGQVMSRTRKRKKERTIQQPGNSSRDGQRTTGSAVTPSSDLKPDDSISDGQMEDFIISTPVELRPEIWDVFEAIIYYNGHIYADLVQHQLGPSAFVIPMTLTEHVPPSIVHTLVCIVLSHRMIQMTEDPGSNILVKPLWTRLYRHQDVALRSINKLMSNDETRTHLLTVISVYVLLFALLQQSFNPCWRTHVHGFMSLIRHFGSVPDIIRDIPDMEASLMALTIVSILANTTSPRDNQFHVASTADALLLIRTYYTEFYYPAVACPPELFTELVHINDLRAQPPSPDTTRSAHAILSRLESFSPEDWSAKHRNHQEEWLLLSRAFHSSVTLYALLSLQSSAALPSSASPELDLLRARHARRLFSLLGNAMDTPKVRKRMTWPLIVAGVEAARASREVQRYVGERLAEMGREQGCAPPLVARAILEKFWDRGGEGGWEGCFGEVWALVL